MRGAKVDRRVISARENIVTNTPIDARVTLEDPTLASLCLSLIPGVGPQLRATLIDRFGSPRAALEAAPSELREITGLGPGLTRRIAAAVNCIDVKVEQDICHRHNIDIVTLESSAYPRNLREIYDPPSVLFSAGDYQPRDALAVAIVGTRHATRYGIRQAERLAASLARAGLTIVSGLARGIDAATHRGALDAGGRTIAVVASGLLNLYPPEHKELAFDIAQQGALISELPPRRSTSRGAFPRRNRIITGMTLGTIVVEAGKRSGALISARLAMEQNREVFAVPGPIDSRVSHGCHDLLRDGAKLVETADDVLSQLGHLVEATPIGHGHQTIHHPAELQLNDQERQVLDLIDTEPTAIDIIVRQSELPVQRILATLSVLEVRRLIRRVSGNSVLRI